MQKTPRVWDDRNAVKSLSTSKALKILEKWRLKWLKTKGKAIKISKNEKSLSTETKK